MTAAFTLRSRIQLALAGGLVVAGMAGASACGARYVRTTLPPPADQLPASSVTRHVIVVSVDGLRPDAIAMFGAPTLQRLMQEGSYSLAARTIDPSRTLPSHTSMLTGLGPEQHHVLWNNVATAKAETIDLPNIFSVARSHGYRTAAFFSKAKFQPLQLDGTLDYSQAPGGLFGKWSAARTIDRRRRVPRDLEAEPALRAPAGSRLERTHVGMDERGLRPRGARCRCGDRPAPRSGRPHVRRRPVFDRRHRRPWRARPRSRQRRSAGRHDSLDRVGAGREAGRVVAPAIRTMDTASTALWLLGVRVRPTGPGRPSSAPTTRCRRPVSRD